MPLIEQSVDFSQDLTLLNTTTSAEMQNKCGYFTFTNAAIELHLISTHS